MRERQIPPDPESGGIPHLFRTFLSPHIGNAWRARHGNNNNNNCDAERMSVVVPVLSVRNEQYLGWDISSLTLNVSWCDAATNA